MAEICRFFWIIIRMYAEERSQHHRPHFHAHYQEHSATFALDPLELLKGSLPGPQRRLVEGWAELHLEELLEDWKRLSSGKGPNKIEPLGQ
jgi:hypothetical protein